MATSFPPFIPSPAPTQPPTLRTSPTLVGQIITVEAGADATPFIYVANTIVTEVCGGSGYSDGFVNSQMELLERWLAAHFYAIFDQQLSAAKAGSVAVKYQYKIDEGLKATMYGQQAMMLDVAGNLAKWNNSAKMKRQIKVSIGWLGHRRRGAGGFGAPWADLTVVQ